MLSRRYVFFGMLMFMFFSLAFFSTVEAGDKHKYCDLPPREEPTPEPTPEPPPIVVPNVPDEDVDACYNHPTNPCVEDEPTAKPTNVPDVATPDVPVQPTAPETTYDTPVLDVNPTVVPTPVIEVQLPPSGELPGPPDTGNAGLKVR